MINKMYALSRWMWLLSHGDVTFQQEARDATLSEGFVPPGCMAECWAQGCWPRHRFISTSAAAATLSTGPKPQKQNPYNILGLPTQAFTLLVPQLCLLSNKNSSHYKLYHRKTLNKLFKSTDLSFQPYIFVKIKWFTTIVLGSMFCCSCYTYWFFCKNVAHL